VLYFCGADFYFAPVRMNRETSKGSFPSEAKSPFSERQERMLVARMAAGDHRAFDAIFRVYFNRVYRLAYKLLGSEPDAKDAVQEVFLAVYQKAGSFRGEAAFSTWLFRLTTNKALSRLRRKKKRDEVPIEDFLPEFRPDGHHRVRPVADWSEGVYDLLERKEFQRAVWRAVDSLRPADKAVVVLSDVEGLSNGEIGKTLGLSLPAVKARLHRARLFLRGKLAVHLGYSPT
jgi:RNA polymerase sigma-70 factor (ECF subfamily)